MPSGTPRPPPTSIDLQPAGSARARSSSRLATSDQLSASKMPLPECACRPMTTHAMALGQPRASCIDVRRAARRTWRAPRRCARDDDARDRCRYRCARRHCGRETARPSDAADRDCRASARCLLERPLVFRRAAAKFGVNRMRLRDRVCGTHASRCSISPRETHSKPRPCGSEQPQDLAVRIGLHGVQHAIDRASGPAARAAAAAIAAGS